MVGKTPTSVPQTPQQVLNPVALQFFGILRCRSCTANFALSAVRSPLEMENCIATLKRLHCKKVVLSCRFPADFRLTRLGPAEQHATANHRQGMVSAGFVRESAVFCEDPAPSTCPKDPTILKCFGNSGRNLLLLPQVYFAFHRW